MHILYYVKPDGTKVRCSRPMSWGAAVDRWNSVYPLSRSRNPRAKGYFAVRSADDPNWPASGRYAQARDLLTGRWA